MALNAAPEPGDATSDIALASSKLGEAKGYLYPQIDILGLTGPAPRLTTQGHSSIRLIASTTFKS